MNEEYKTLRAETMECISKQDTLTNIVFTLLGISNLYSAFDPITAADSTAFGHIVLLILVEFASAVLLARVLHYRNAVSYLSSYLLRLEAVSDTLEIQWETNLSKFNNYLPKAVSNWDPFSKVIYKIIWYARSFKHLGNLILSICLFVLILFDIEASDYAARSLETIVFLVLAIIAFIINITFSFAICFSIKVKEKYISVWKEVLPNQLASISQAQIREQKNENVAHTNPRRTARSNRNFVRRS